MADMTGLAYLMSLIGGAGKGQYEGFSAGLQDQKDAANLAEKKRQFDEGQFTNITPDMATRLDMPAGRTRNTLIPSLLNASEKDAARAEAQRQNEVGAAALEKAANTFGTPNIANPEVAGTEAPSSEVVTPGRPEPMLKMLADLQRSGVKSENPLIQTWMKGQPGMNPTQQGVFAPKMFTDPDGNTIMVQGSKAGGLTGPPVNVGITQPVSKGQTYTAMDHYAVNVLGLPRGSQEYSAYMAQAVPTPTLVGPDIQAYSRPSIVGQPPATGQPQGRPGTPQPLVSREVKATPEEIKAAARDQTYLQEIMELADRVEKLHEANKNGGQLTPSGRMGNAGMALRNFMVNKVDPTGALAGAFPLDKELGDIQAMAERLLRDYEQTTGGMRAVSGPQIQAALRAVHGGDVLSNPNAAINLRSIAKSTAMRMNYTDVMERATGRTPLHGVEPGLQERTQRPIASPGNPQQQYREGERLYSPSQKKWGTIRGNDWIPD